MQQYHQSVLRRADEEGGSSRTQALSSFLHENDLLAAAVDAREDPEFSSLVASQFGGLLEFSASTLAGTSSSPAGSVLSAQVSQLASLHFSLVCRIPSPVYGPVLTRFDIHMWTQVYLICHLLKQPHLRPSTLFTSVFHILT